MTCLSLLLTLFKWNITKSSLQRQHPVWFKIKWTIFNSGVKRQWEKNEMQEPLWHLLYQPDVLWPLLKTKNRTVRPRVRGISEEYGKLWVQCIGIMWRKRRLSSFTWKQTREVSTLILQCAIKFIIVCITYFGKASFCSERCCHQLALKFLFNKNI